MTNDTSTATQHITNTLLMAATSTNQTQRNKQKPANKTVFNPYKMITTMKPNGNPTQKGSMTTMIKKLPLKSRCQIKWWNQAMEKGVKTIQLQKILTILEQLQKANPTITVYQFYTTNKNLLDHPYPLLQGKIKLPAGPSRNVIVLPRITTTRATRIHIYLHLS